MTPRDGRWLVRWRDPSGRQRKKSFSRKVDAQRWSDQTQAASHRGQFIDPVAARLKVDDFAQTWLDGMAHLKPSTAARYASIVRVHIEPQLDSVAVALDPLVPHMCYDGSFRPSEEVPSEQLNLF